MGWEERIKKTAELINIRSISYVGRKDYSLFNPLQWFERISKEKNEIWKEQGILLMNISEYASRIGDNRAFVQIGNAVSTAAANMGVNSFFQFAQMVSPNDMVVLITLETKVADVEGMMNFCIPYITIEPILSKFSAQYWYASIRRGSTSENLKIIKEKLQNIFVETSAELGSMQLPLSDILNLQKGDVVKFTDTKITDPVIFKIGNRKKFLCRPGISGSRMAVQLTGVMDGEADITEDDLLKEED